MKTVDHFPLIVIPLILVCFGTFGFVHHENKTILASYTQDKPLNYSYICECVSACRAALDCNAATYSVTIFGILCWLPLGWVKYSYLKTTVGYSTFFPDRTFRLVGNQFYYMATTNGSWSDANQTCYDLGGGLATLENDWKKKQVLRFILKSRIRNFFIGLFNFNVVSTGKVVTSQVAQNPSWVLINGSVIPYTKPLDPWNLSLVNKCYNYNFNSSTGLWSIQNIVGCQGQLSYICVKD